MTRLVCISDDHHKRYYIDLPEGDILVHGGDFSYRGEKIEQLLIKEWLIYQSHRYKDIVFIAGNHDINFTRLQTRDLPVNVHHLQDSHEVVQGITFYGSPYTPRFGNWGFGEQEDKLAKRFAHIRKDTEVLITHGPPRGILDMNKNQEPCGSLALYDRIKHLPNLKHHIFGHIHEQGGKTEIIEDVQFHNVSILDEYYQIKNPATIIEV